MPGQEQVYSCLVVGEAKESRDLNDARAELLGHMACIKGRREELGRHDITVYGVRSDGFWYEFVELQASGIVRFSDQLDVRSELTLIVTTLTFILEQAANTSNIPEELEDHFDDIMKLAKALGES